MANQRYKSSGKRQQKQQATKIDFAIEKMDGMGQGVSRDEGKVAFIAKSLPDEEGTARVFKRSKGVMFAQIDKIKNPAENRIEPACPHFNECPACHYLHTDYASELSYKKQAMQDLFRQLPLPKQGITVIEAPERLNYRNRLQLHYRHKYIGMVDGLSDQIIEIPECKIIRPELQASFNALYADKEWTEEQSGGGHIELYWRDEEVSVQWDQPYAHGGFTQVYQAMNDLLCEKVNAWLSEQKFTTLLDLFSGKGNLSNAAMIEREDQRMMVDYSPSGDDANFVNMDLFDEDAARRFQHKTKSKQFDMFIVDPPRKGFPLIADWVKKFKPKKMAYVSCNAATLVRDLKSLEKSGIKYRIQEVLLMDLFPGTYHYESIVFIEFKGKIKAT